MTDNELLLAMSDLMDKKLNSALQAELQPVKDDIRDLGHRITAVEQNLDNKIASLDNRVRSIELHLENVTDKNIQLLAENYVPAAKRYEKATAQIESMQTDIDVMKSVIREHSETLQQIS